MKTMTRNMLQIPQGTESFYLDEAQQHQRIVNKLQRLFELWGYLPVETPVFDFFDIYSGLLDQDTVDKTYRLIDRDGELLMLRSDITLFLAKQMGLLLGRGDLPARVSYAGAILRHQDREDISHNEFFQSGIELIGRDGAKGDLEVLAILCRTFEELGVKPYIHAGSRGFFDRICIGFPADQKTALRDALRVSDKPLIGELLARNMADRERGRTMGSILTYMGDPQGLTALTAAEKAFLSVEEAQELGQLADSVQTIQNLFPAAALRIDLSEVGSQPYYTGMVFQAYVEGMDSAVASGGRYDRLLEFFGFPCPSVGFSILLRKLQKMTKQDDKKERFADLSGGSGDFSEVYKKAEENRKKGIITRL